MLRFVIYNHAIHVYQTYPIGKPFVLDFSYINSVTSHSWHSRIQFQ